MESSGKPPSPAHHSKQHVTLTTDPRHRLSPFTQRIIHTPHLHVVFRLQHQMLLNTSGRAAGAAGPNWTLVLEHRKWRQGPEPEVQRCSNVVCQLEVLFDVKVTQLHLQRTSSEDVGEQERCFWCKESRILTSLSELPLRKSPAEARNSSTSTSSSISTDNLGRENRQQAY